MSTRLRVTIAAEENASFDVVLMIGFKRSLSSGPSEPPLQLDVVAVNIVTPCFPIKERCRRLWPSGKVEVEASQSNEVHKVEVTVYLLPPRPKMLRPDDVCRDTASENV